MFRCVSDEALHCKRAEIRHSRRHFMVLQTESPTVGLHLRIVDSMSCYCRIRFSKSGVLRLAELRFRSGFNKNFSRSQFMVADSCCCVSEEQSDLISNCGECRARLVWPATRARPHTLVCWACLSTSRIFPRVFAPNCA